MKVAIIGSTQYKERMEDLYFALLEKGIEAIMPCLDDRPELDELGIMTANLDAIKWADGVCLVWDCRSPGAWGDWCMAFALGKPVWAYYMEPKRLDNAIYQYERQHRLGETENAKMFRELAEYIS